MASIWKTWDASRGVNLPGDKPVIGPRLGRIVEAVTDRLIPDGGKIDVPVDETDCYRFLARYLRDMGAGERFGIKALFVAFDLAPFIFIGRMSRFVNLTPQEQELYIMDWGASRIYLRRMALTLLKTLTGAGYYGDPKVLGLMGFEMPCEEGGGK